MNRKKKRIEDGISFPQYINTNERTVEVVGCSNGDPMNATSGTTYLESKGYIIDRAITLGKEPKEDKAEPGVWIYCAAKPLHPDMYPYFWKKYRKEEDGSTKLILQFSDPAPLILNAFSVDNMHDMSIVNIVERTIPGEVLFNEQELQDISASSNFYVPIIYERDDYLKKVVKTAIIEKGINVNKLKSRTDEKYQIPNMLAALRNTTKMSVMYFACWMELLRCDFAIKVTDDGTNQVDVLKNPIVYQSSTGIIEEEVNGELKPLDPAKYHTQPDDEES